MLTTDLADYTPEAGELVDFHLSSALPGRQHPAPPSFVQEQHIRRVRANRAAGRPQSPWVAVSFDLPGRLDAAAMAVALRKWVARHPTLLTWFSDAEPLVRYALPADAVTVHPVATRVPAGSDEIRAHIAERFDSGTNPLRWPPFVAGAIVRDTTSTVYFAVDHSHTDGYSLLLVFHELRSLYTGAEDELPAVGSYVDYCALERSRTSELHPESPVVRRWVEFWLRGDGKPPTFPLDLGAAGGTRPKVRAEVDLLDGAQAESFAMACKANGSGFTAGLFAALAIVGHELADQREYRGLTVVHTRDEPRWQSAQGWFINVAPMMFPAVGSFAEVVEAAHRSFATARDMAKVPLHHVLEALGTVGTGSTAAPPIVSYLDMRHVPGSTEWESTDYRAISGPGETQDVSIWVNRLFTRTSVSYTYPDTDTARANVHRYLDRLRQVLTTVAREGDYRAAVPAAQP